LSKKVIFRRERKTEKRIVRGKRKLSKDWKKGRTKR
jgi:hypothetical protein